jgi:CheY-like chemotaxis protein
LQLLRADPWTRDIPVILFTAFAGDPDRLRALRVSDIVLKPFQAQTLCEVIRRALASRSDTRNLRMPLNAAMATMGASPAATGATA